MSRRRPAAWSRAAATLALLGALAACGEEPAADAPAADGAPAVGSGIAPVTAPAPPAVGRLPEGLDLPAARALRDRTVWAAELEAGRHGAVVVDLWDALRGAADPLTVLAEAPVERLSLGELGPPEPLEHGVTRRVQTGSGADLARGELRALAAALAADGHALVHSQWSHERFVPADEEQAARSWFGFELHVTQRALQPLAQPGEAPRAALDAGADERRMIVRGSLEVQWAPEAAADDNRELPEPRAAHARVVDLELLERRGPPVLEPVLARPGEPAGPRPNLVEPILIQDLDGDGRSDLVLVGSNLVLSHAGDGVFRERALTTPPVRMDAALLADLDGDGAVDLLGAATGSAPVLFTRRDAQGRFVDPRELHGATPPLRAPMALTAGDIDADGDLDVFLAQYKPPYLGGQFPTPYHDANDGYPAYLLVNLGDGRFADGTQGAGLAPKRLRRSYSASLTDLDGDLDQDLLVVSDFAGVDLYLNDGTGRFTDVTAQRFGPDHATFGMGHSFLDADGDGRLDLYVIGMSSATARRLDALGLGRPDVPSYTERRPVMSHGNRLYLGRLQGRMALADGDATLARTGWSWGSTAFDLENDGDRDVFVATGHVSGASAADHCSTFWRHDLYDATSDPNAGAERVFLESMRPLVRGETSWDGHEANVLLTRSPSGWTSSAFLWGAAQSWDARATASADLDGDGLADLVIVERTSPARGDVAHVLLNRWRELHEPHGWIGVRLEHGVPGRSPLGATIRVVDSAGRTHVQRVTSGDGHRAQHDAAALFGFGDARPVRLEVVWPDGARVERNDPPADAWLGIAPPPRAGDGG